MWTLERWMGSDVALNDPAILKALGKKVDEKWIKVANIAKEMSPRGHPLIHLNVENVVAALRRMATCILLVVIERGCGDDWPELCHPPEP